MRPHPKDPDGFVEWFCDAVCLVGIVSFIVYLLLYIHDPRLVG